MVVDAGVIYVVVVRAGVSTTHPVKPKKPIHKTYRMECLLIPMSQFIRRLIVSKRCLPEPRSGGSGFRLIVSAASHAHAVVGLSIPLIAAPVFALVPGPVALCLVPAHFVLASTLIGVAIISSLVKEGLSLFQEVIICCRGCRKTRKRDGSQETGRPRLVMAWRA